MSFEKTINYFDNSKHADKLKKVTCDIPFRSFHIYPEGNVANCCFYWMPTILGNITKKTLKEIINDERSMAAKKSVTDGTYKFCNGEICPSMVNYTANGKVEHPLLPIEDLHTIDQKDIILMFDFDHSCNLYCGSCRNDRILYSLENAPPHLKLVHECLMKQVAELLDDGYKITIQATSSGDPFASPFYWQFLQSIRGDEQYKVRLTTNGTLMTRERLQHPYAKKIDHIEISVDAFTEETYVKVRRGGNFTALKKNLQNLDEMVMNGDLPELPGWKVNFVVQTDNFHEMADFAKWALEFKKLNYVWFLLIYDWGHLKKEEFNQKAVWHKNHPQHREFLKVLRDPVFDDKRIIIGNVAALRKQALADADLA
ncbi:MAG: hypothetical protein K0R29_1270 [Pseudobdellovibrio sp.]|jgi:radical SAM protein with 4Fe4S-binding SPASM domain|nr:hypothetical protein [Pseudobdellovibrio sp.]